MFTKDKTITRTLDHPRDLELGDIIKFQYLSQNDLSNQQFEITSENTYDFEDRKLTEFTLKGDVKDTIHLIVDETGDEPFLRQRFIVGCIRAAKITLVL